MKRILLLAIFVCLISAFAFAADYTVQSVTGKVESAGVTIKAGDIISTGSSLRTNIGASVVLIDEAGSAVTIPAGRNGKVEDLIKAVAGNKVGSNVVVTDTGTASAQSRTTSTASARASDQAGDANIAAE